MNEQEFSRLIGAFALLVYTAIIGFLAFRSNSTGRFSGKGVSVRREERPKLFAIARICYFGLSACCIFGAVVLMFMTFAKR
ncbi:MAG TPA: hypothetical protein VMA13_08420 [Candidatus Saccharimonadales bacterium]|nr:hypothetical protein [Candidatus Saccharimonadales bacterium]